MRSRKVVICVLVAALALGAVAHPLRQAHDFCAVRLSVVDVQTGHPVLSAVAQLIDPSGRIVQTAKIINGRATFCDFGFGKYSILIRGAESDCLATEIKNVHVIPYFTQDLKADLNSCADEGDGGGNACFTYVRVTSPSGQAVATAEIKNRQSIDVDHTDSYGRARVAVPSGSREDFTFLRQGYKTGHLSLTCASRASGWGEAAVVLQPEKQDGDAR